MQDDSLKLSPPEMVIYKYVLNPQDALTEKGQLLPLPRFSKIISVAFDDKTNNFVVWAEISTSAMRRGMETARDIWRIRMFETGKPFRINRSFWDFIGTTIHFSGYVVHVYAQKDELLSRTDSEKIDIQKKE